MQNNAFKTFYLVPKALDRKLKTIIKTFDLVAKVVRTYLAVDRMHY